MWVDIMLMGTIRAGLGGDGGETPIRDKSLNNLAPIISGFD